MPLQPKMWLAVGVAVALVAGVLGVLFVRHDDEARGATEDRLHERLERTSVQLHLAIRARLDREGERFAARLERAADDDAEAEALAHVLLDDLDAAEPDPSGAPVLAHFGGGELSPAADRLHLVLGMLWSERHPERAERIPTYALLHEARALSPSELGSPHRELAHAARAYAHAVGGYCHMVERLEEVAPPSAAELVGWVEGEQERAAAARRLGQLRRFLVDGSLACCAMRAGRPEETARRLELSVRDAELLGVSERRLPLLEAWAAVLAGDRARARELLDELPRDRLHEDDQEAHRIIRSALAIEGEDAASRAMEGTTRAAWLSRLVVAGALEVVEGSELAGLLWTGEPARAAERFVRGEAAVIAAARRVAPFFDQRR